MDFIFPEFKRIDKIVDGELSEKFYIDDKEVSESTYYTLLEDRMGINNTNNLKNNTVKKNETNISNNKPNNEYQNEKDEYINSLIQLLDDNPDDQFDILYDELVYHYKLGYFMGQLDLNDNYAKAMKQNYRVIQNKIDDLTDEYEKD